jgi:hypothetical protein
MYNIICISVYLSVFSKILHTLSLLSLIPYHFQVICRIHFYSQKRMFLHNVELSLPNLKFQQNNLKLDLEECNISKWGSNGLTSNCINTSDVRTVRNFESSRVFKNLDSTRTNKNDRKNRVSTRIS